MCSTTRQINAFGRRMTLEQVVGYIQKNYQKLFKEHHKQLLKEIAEEKELRGDKFIKPCAVTAVARVLGVPQDELRGYAYGGVEMDSRFAMKLGNKIRQMFGDSKLPKPRRTVPHHYVATQRAA